MGKQRDHQGTGEQHQTDPANPAVVTQAAEQRIAHDAGQKDAANGQTRGLELVTLSLLQKKRAEASHAVAGKIAQTKEKTRADEKHPERRRRKHFFRRADWIARE